MAASWDDPAQPSRTTQGADPHSDWISREMMARRTSYNVSESVSIFCGTCNIAARDAPTAASTIAVAEFRQWLASGRGQGGTHPDLIAIGLQEMVNLNNPWNTTLGADLSASHQAALWGQFLLAVVNHLEEGPAAAGGGRSEPKCLKQAAPEYMLVRHAYLIGLGLYIFAAKPVAPFITDVRQAAVGAGFLGGGNKGGVTVSLCMHDTPLCFTNMHLGAGRECVERRNQDYQLIVDRTELLPSAPIPMSTPASSLVVMPLLWLSRLAGSGSDKQPSGDALFPCPGAPLGPWHERFGWLQGAHSLSQHEVAIVLGDLNYHLRCTSTATATSASALEPVLTAARVIESLSAGGSFSYPSSPPSLACLEELLQHDQLRGEMREGRVLAGHVEAPISFPPTYRFRSTGKGWGPDADPDDEEEGYENGDPPRPYVYDPERCPAWCDRVLYRDTPAAPARPCQPSDNYPGRIAASLRPTIYQCTPNPLNRSDHTAVSCSFFCAVRRVNEVLERQAMESVVEQLQQWESRMWPSVEVDNRTVDFGLLSRKKRGVAATVKLRNTSSTVSAEWRVLDVGRTTIALVEGDESASGGIEVVGKEVDTTWLRLSGLGGKMPGRGSVSASLASDGDCDMTDATTAIAASTTTSSSRSRTIPGGGIADRAGISHVLRLQGRLDGKTARALYDLSGGVPRNFTLGCVVVLQVRGGSHHYVSVGATCEIDPQGKAAVSTSGMPRRKALQRADRSTPHAGYLPSSDEDDKDSDLAHPSPTSTRSRASPLPLSPHSASPLASLSHGLDSAAHSLVSVTDSEATDAPSTASSRVPLTAERPLRDKEFVCWPAEKLVYWW